MSGGDGLENKTCIFWNLDDCPIPNGLNPISVYSNIKSTLANMGCDVGNAMSINCYATDLTTLDVPTVDEFRQAGMKLFILSAENRVEWKFKMVWDCLLWRVDRSHPKEEANIIFIVNLSDLIETPDYYEFLRVFDSLKFRDHNVIIAQPGEVVAPELLPKTSSVWHSQRLLSGFSSLVDLTGSFDYFNSAEDMEVLGMARLKIELKSRGLKCEGSLQECAAMLFLSQSTKVK